MFVAVRLDVEALPRNEVAAVILVNTGFGDTAMVEVEERTMFDPAVKYVAGEVKILFHCVVEAVSGTTYPDWVAIEKLWLEPFEMIWKSRPFAVVVENVCDAAVSPANDVSPPPAPASAPQENVPVVVL